VCQKLPYSARSSKYSKCGISPAVATLPETLQIKTSQPSLIAWTLLTAPSSTHEICLGEYSRANLILTNENLAADSTIQQWRIHVWFEH